MGSLTSRPKVPTSRPVQIISAPTAAAPAPDPQSNDDTAADAQELRRQSLLGRDRGRLGTIATSFRGPLGLGDAENQKKTLLGE